ncbi:MAG: radical SAM protein [bacterium]|nr:radical SAM protein [bacterium]
MNDLFKYLYYKVTPGKKCWYPFLSVYYLTYRCQFRCPYCSDGSGTPYHQLKADDPEGETAVAILKKIRRYCNQVVITGGEPLDHPRFSYVMEQLPALKFKEVVLTTNGYDLETYLPEVAKAVDTLVFSIDTLDRDRADAWNGIGPGTLEKILGNISLARGYGGKKYKIYVSVVVTPENIDDLYKVYEYARQHRYVFAAAPQLEGVKANRKLENNPEYRRFFDYLVEEKRKGGPVFGFPLYLEYMRDLAYFKCNPFTMLVVGPTGEVFYPCLEIGKHAGNILETDSLHSMRLKGEEQFGPQPKCGTQCHSACALGFALLLKNLFSVGFNAAG